MTFPNPNRLPPIPEADLAAHYVPSELFERALLVIDHYPNLRVHPSIAATVPVYRERREAAARVLKKNPGARRDMVKESRAHVGTVAFTAPVNAPPTAEETSKLRQRVAAAAKRYRELRSAGVDTDALRVTFQEAVRSGDFRAAVAAHDDWVRAIADDANTDRERATLDAELCLRPTGAPPGRAFQPGDPLHPNYPWPNFTDEISRALRRVPEAKEKGARK
jgi:hypothetical protein